MSDDLATIGYAANLTGINKINKGLDSVAKTGEKTEKRMVKSANGISSSFRIVGAAVAAIASSKAISKLVSISREFDILNAQLITATGSAKNAATAFTALQNFAATTPYDLAQAVKGFTQLVNLGLTPSEAALRSYGNTASAMGKDLNQMIEAVADATTGEFERLKEFGIKAKSEGDDVSLTFQGVTTKIGKNAADIERYLINIGQVEFAGAMAQRAKTLDGALSNFGDTWDSLFLTISKRGIGDLITENVFDAANAIQSLDDYIASGALENGFSAMSSRFDNYLADFNRSFEIIGTMIGESEGEWGRSLGEFFDNMSSGFKQLPEMVRFYIQKITVEIAGWVDKAVVDAGAFVDIMSLSFSHVLDIAELKGKQISNAMNPFSDDIDFSSEFAKIESQFNSSFSSILDNAKAEKQAYDNIVNDMVMGFAKEAVAAADSYDIRIRKSDEMLKAYLKEKEAAKSATDLGQFKIKPASRNKSTALTVMSDDIDKVKNADIGNPFESMTNGAMDAMSAMSQMFESGSKDAQKLAIAMQTLNLIQAVGAVLNQGSGDPYTAFGRMAAMAAAVAGLGMSLDASFGGDIADRSGDIQESQGLNQWGEKATSMDDSLSMISNATDNLVGINSGMLTALQNMQISLSGAAGSVAKNISSIAAPLPDELPIGFGGALSFLHGSSSTVDEGVKIIGGQLNDMLSDITVQAYNTINFKKWRYGSVHSKTAFENVGEEVNKQFSLVFNSIADAVMSGSTALGINAKDAAMAIGASIIDDISISTRGVSITEKTEAINNALSDVFNNLSSEVIPWLSDLQQAGEDLGTTLSRVSTQVSIADLMVERFGVTFGNKLANPEMYAKAADNLTTLVGGVEELPSKTSAFIDSFASDETKLLISQNALNNAFNDAGLILPKTATGMWELMDGLDGATDAGANQIATILNLTDVSSDYYDMLDDQYSAMASLSNSLADTVMNIYDVSDGINQVGLDSALAAARIGDFSLAESLNLDDYSLSDSTFASAAAFSIAQAEAANKLMELSRLSAGASGDVQTQQLDVLNSINENIIASMKATTELMIQQNVLQADSSSYLEKIDMKTVYSE